MVLLKICCIYLRGGEYIKYHKLQAKRFWEKFNTKIMIVNNETLSHNEELVQDMISILDVFSCRLYGLRKYKNQIKERYLKSMV